MKNALIQAYLTLLKILIFLNIWEPNLNVYLIMFFKKIDVKLRKFTKNLTPGPPLYFKLIT